MRERLDQLAFQKFRRMKPTPAEISFLRAKDGLHSSLLKSVGIGGGVAWVPSWNARLSELPALKVWLGCHAGPWSWKNVIHLHVRVLFGEDVPASPDGPFHSC